MKRNLFGIFAVLTASMLLFSACGAKSSAPGSPRMSVSSSAAAADMAAYEEAGMVQESVEMAAPQAKPIDPNTGAPGDTAESPVADVPLADRKIIKHSTLDLETKSFDDALVGIRKLVEDAGGYIEGQNIDGRSMNYSGGYYERNAFVNARVPAEKLDEVTTQIGTLCNIVTRNEMTEDITDSYFDSKVHLDTLAIQEERLLEILKKATKLEDVVTLEKALSDVRYEIESLTAALKRMDSQVAFSYLNFNLHEVVEYQEVNNAPKGFGEKLAASLGRSGDHLLYSVQNTLLVIVEIGPVLLLWFAIVFGLVLIVRAVLRRMRKRKTPMIAPQEPEKTETEKKN